MGTIVVGTVPADAAAPRVETVYRPRHPVDLRMTLGPLGRGGQSPTMLWDQHGVWLTSRTVAGPATLLLTTIRGEVRATAWGAGAEQAIAAVPELLGDGDDWTGLDVSANDFLRAARRRAVGLRLLRTGHVLDAVIAAIIEQKVTSVEAWRAWRQLVTRYGESAPGPAPTRMRVIPSPQGWRAIPSWAWHRAGVDPRRSAAAVAAARVASGLERTLGLGRGGPEVLARLQSVPGIGPWTAAEASQRAHGDPDSVECRRLPPAGDRGLGVDRQAGRRRRDARAARAVARPPATGDAPDRRERLPPAAVRSADDHPGPPRALTAGAATHPSAHRANVLT